MTQSAQTTILRHHSRHLRKIGNNEDFSKTQILVLSSKFIKFYIQWSKIDQFRNDLTAFYGMKFDTNETSVINFVPHGIKKCIRNCKNTLKKSFRNTFFGQKLSRNVKQIKMLKEKHIKPYLFHKIWLKCSLNITLLMLVLALLKR